eukprot:2737829-Pyramimonas_sp.AAC.1
MSSDVVGRRRTSSPPLADVVVALSDVYPRRLLQWAWTSRGLVSREDMLRMNGEGPGRAAALER